MRGRHRELGLGHFAQVFLAEVSEKAPVNCKPTQTSGDSTAEKRRIQGIPTIAEAESQLLE